MAVKDFCAFYSIKSGKVGECIAVKFLENKGFEIIEQNYRKKYGEIDIIAQKGKILHFIEVKSVSCEKISGLVRASRIP